MSEATETKESVGMKIKKFVIRNRKKFIIGSGIIGGVLLGGGILKKKLDSDDGDYIECVEEDYESVEYTGDSDDCKDEDSSEE